MSLFTLFQSKCAICKKKRSGLRKYRNDRGEIINVCPTCSEYAERRAYRKV